MRRITLTCVDAGGGHACGLALGLKKYGDVDIVWENPNKHGLDYLNPDAKFGFNHIPLSGDDLIIVSCITFDRILKRFSKYLLQGYERVHIIVTDGKFPRNPDYYNKVFGKYDVITTACKRHFREPHPVKTYYQPFDFTGVDITKNDTLTIAHSPFVKVKFKEKGTEEIIKIIWEHNSQVKNCDTYFDLITGVPWKECIRRKAKAHIFVDQIDHYDRDKFKFKSKDYVWPALGKSGIEALHLGCLVITHGKGYDTEIPAPPVAWCNGNFKEVLDYYIKHEKERIEMAAEGRKWALKYASYDFAAQNVLR